MRNRKALFSVAIAPAAVLIAGTVVMASGPLGTNSTLAVVLPSSSAAPTSCTPDGTETTFTVTSGPTFVPCGDGGQCTQIEYKVDSPPEGAVYALEGLDVFSVSGNGSEAAAPCFGFPNDIPSFGVGSCHEQVVKAFLDDSRKFTVTLNGQRNASPTSVAIRGNGGPLACEILGIGLESSRNPEQPTQTTETINFKGCVVQFTRDALTGDVLRAQLTPDSPPTCTSPFGFIGDARALVPQLVTDLEIRQAVGGSLGFGKFGDGYISTGSESCTTRVIGGKVYTWGTKPCP